MSTSVAKELHALIVEDSPEIAKLFQMHLDRDGSIATKIVHSLQEAVATIKSSEPAIDAILLDLGLPDAEEMVSLLALRALAPLVPILVVTGKGPLLEETAYQAGADDYLEKPMHSPSELVGRLRKAVLRRRAYYDTYLKFAPAYAGIAKTEECLQEARVVQSIIKETQAASETNGTKSTNP